jgi:hypothetical protein
MIRKWQSKVFGHLVASGEGGQLREPSDDMRLNSGQGARKKFPFKKCLRNFVLSFPYTQLDSLIELEGSPPRAAKAEGEYRPAQKTEMKRSFQSAPKIPMQLISGGNTLVTPNRH